MLILSSHFFSLSLSPRSRTKRKNPCTEALSRSLSSHRLRQNFAWLPKDKTEDQATSDSAASEHLCDAISYIAHGNPSTPLTKRIKRQRDDLDHRPIWSFPQPTAPPATAEPTATSSPGVNEAVFYSLPFSLPFSSVLSLLSARGSADLFGHLTAVYPPIAESLKSPSDLSLDSPPP